MYVLEPTVNSDLLRSRVILNVNNFPPNEQTQNIVESINDSNLQMRDLEESSRNSDNVDISRTEILSVTEEENSNLSRDSTEEFSSIGTSIGINTTSNNDSSHTENQSSLQYVWSENESSIFYTNADSLLNKRDELALLISTNKYDIVVVTEVLPKNRTSSDISDVEFHISGYNMYNTMLGNNIGRGIIIYVKNDINATALKLFELQHIEATGIKIKLRNSDWLFLIAVYRSPNCHEDCLVEVEQILSYDKEGPCRASHRVILGDFNLRGINWVTETSNVNENHIDTKFLEAVRDNYLFQHVKQVTRTKENQQDSLLDLILTNEENMIDNIRYLPPLGKSDHLVIQFSLITYINRFRTQTEKLNFFKGNYDQLRTNLRNIAWDEAITEAMNLKESWESFTDIINHEVRENIPVCKAFKRKHDTPWITRTSLKAIKKKHTKWKKYQYCKSQTNKEAYDKAKKEASKVTKAAKMDYEKQISENIKTNNKAFWNYVQSKTKTRESVGNLVDNSGVTVTEGAN